MEQKKTLAADLEHRRPAMLILGAIVAFALVVAVLEYNAGGSAGDYDSDLLDEIAEEMEFMPPFEDNDPLPLQEEKITLSDQVVVEDEQTSQKEEEKAEQAPVFPGGMMQLMKWLTKNLRYPEVARRAKVSGKVVVAFMVNTDGSVSDVKLIKNVEPSLDREALRVVRMMPNWEPGISGGKVCRTLVHLPIVFKF